MPSNRFIRLSELASTGKRPGLIPVSPATVWRWVKSGKFPQPARLSSRVTAWNLNAIENWLSAQQADQGAAEKMKRPSSDGPTATVTADARINKARLMLTEAPRAAGVPAPDAKAPSLNDQHVPGDLMPGCRASLDISTGAQS